MPLPKKKTERESNYLKKIFLIYGLPKIGKTTIASQFGDDVNKVLFFATEAGHKEQEIFKWHLEEVVQETNFETGEVTDVVIDRDPYKWEHFLTCVYEMSKQNDFKCLVVDTADNLFDWCQAYTRKKHNIDHESDLGFGKGYDILKKEFAAPINYLSQKGYGVIFLSHQKEQEVEEKRRKFTKIDTTLPNTAKKIIQPLADYILYFHADDDGNRLIRTKGTQNITAGDRSGRLPELLPMDSKILINNLTNGGVSNELV